MGWLSGAVKLAKAAIGYAEAHPEVIGKLAVTSGNAAAGAGKATAQAAVPAAGHVIEELPEVAKIAARTAQAPALDPAVAAAARARVSALRDSVDAEAEGIMKAAYSRPIRADEVTSAGGHAATEHTGNVSSGLDFVPGRLPTLKQIK